MQTVFSSKKYSIDDKLFSNSNNQQSEKFLSTISTDTFESFICRNDYLTFDYCEEVFTKFYMVKNAENSENSEVKLTHDEAAN